MYFCVGKMFYIPTRNSRKSYYKLLRAIQLCVCVCVCVSETCDSSHTGGVQGPPYGPWRGAGAELLPGTQGTEPPEALEFSANKGIQDGRQE